jgi:hypothetical protein
MGFFYLLLGLVGGITGLVVVLPPLGFPQPHPLVTVFIFLSLTNVIYYKYLT